MAILLPYDVLDNVEKRNTYMVNFYNSLKSQNIDIKSSPKDWIEKSKKFSAVVIHWPEGLPRSNCETEFDFLEFTLNRIAHFRKYSKIFYFVHNLKSHKSFIEINERLYDSVINNSDAVFHLSDYSKRLFASKYPNLERNYVVPHGNYANLLNIKSEKLEFNINSFKKNSNLTVSAIGSVRKYSEFNILYKFAKEYLSSNCNFIFAGRLVGDIHMNSYEKKYYFIKNFILYKLKILNLIKYYRKLKLKSLGKNIKVFPSFVRQTEIKNICEVSDILIIFRSDSLNSGNIPLGFTFGCYVVGPNIGNIGEILKRNNNTVFDIKNIDYKATVNHSIKNLNDDNIKNNKKLALKYWDWNRIAEDLKKIFLELEVCD